MTRTDTADSFDWLREIESIRPDFLDRIVVNDDGAVASATWNGAAMAGDFGQMFGSQLGRLLGGDDPFAKLAAGTVMGAIGKEVGKALFSSASFSLDVVVKDAFGTLGGGAGVGSLPGAAIGAISSLLMSELADAVDLHGFAGGLFTTVGTTLTTQLITNAYGVATGATVNGLPNGPLYTMFTGFDSGAIVTQLEGAVAGYLGSTLSAHVAAPHYAEGATGHQIGSSIGGLVGVWFGGPVGAFIGSFVGGLAGSLIGDTFGFQPESHGRLEFRADHHFQPYGPSFWGDHGGTGVPFSKIAAYTGDVVNRLADFAGVQMNATPVGSAQTAVGMQLSYTQIGTDFWVSEESGSIVAIAHNVSSKEDADKLSPLAEAGIMNLVHRVPIIGGDPLVRYAWAHSTADNASAFALDLQVARDYRTYLDDAPDAQNSSLGFEAKLENFDNELLLKLNELPDGSSQLQKFDPDDFQSWDHEIQRIHPDFIDKIVIDDNGAAASATWHGAALAGDIGGALGSSLGRLLGGNSVVGQVAAGTVLGTIGKEIGKALFMGGTYTLDVAVKDTFGVLGGGSGVGALPSAAIGAVSSLLIGELAKALHLDGFEGGLFTTVGASVTTQLITNAYGVATGATLPNPVLGGDPIPYTMFTGFDPTTLVTNIGGAVGGFLGSTLAGHVMVPQHEEGAIGGQNAVRLAVDPARTERRRRGRQAEKKQRGAAKIGRGRSRPPAERRAA